MNELLRRRLECGCSQAAVCRAARVHPGDYVLMEKGKCSPFALGRWSTDARRLAHFYACTPEDLFPAHVREHPAGLAEVMELDERAKNALTATAEHFLDYLELSSVIKRVLATLTPREERVLRMRFGLDGQCAHTRAESGQDFEVSSERIRKIEAKALCKLRHPSRAKLLKAFL